MLRERAGEVLVDFFDGDLRLVVPRFRELELFFVEPLERRVVLLLREPGGEDVRVAMGLTLR